MADSGSRSGRALIPQLGRLIRQGSLTGFSEAQLLEAFIARNDEAAFEAIVTRHGPMVLNVCRQLLRDPNDVDDAFQATFLVLARRAGSLKRQDLLGNWLYGVAYRVATRSRSTVIRTREKASPDTSVEALACPETASSSLDSDELFHLHEAVNHLPDRYRIPIVLCYFEGLTHEEASARLGWPLGSVKGRLARARDLLRPQLVRRGFGLSAATVLMELEQNARATAVPQILRVTTVRSALAFSGEAAGTFIGTSAISLSAGTLAQGVIRTMFLSQIRALILPTLIGVGVVTTGASVVAFQGSGKAKSPENPPTKASSNPSLAKTDPKTKAILEKLDEPITMDFGSNTPIEDVLKYIQAATSGPNYLGIPIYVDPVGLQEVKKNLKSAISIKLDGVPLRTTLRLILAQLDLAYHVQDGFLRISSPRGIIEAIQKAEIERAERELADAVIQADQDPKTKQILKKLDLPISMDFMNETPIGDILKYIQSATSDSNYSGIPIYVDPRGLQEVEKTLRSPATIKLEETPLRATLKILLKQLGLDYCVHGGFLMISSPDRIHDELEQAQVELGISKPRMELAPKTEAEARK